MIVVSREETFCACLVDASFGVLQTENKESRKCKIREEENFSNFIIGIQTISSTRIVLVSVGAPTVTYSSVA